MTYQFTAAEVSHLLTLLRDAADEGNYYGNREQYWKRHYRIEDKLKAGLEEKPEVTASPRNVVH